MRASPTKQEGFDGCMSKVVSPLSAPTPEGGGKLVIMMAYVVGYLPSIPAAVQRPALKKSPHSSACGNFCSFQQELDNTLPSLKAESIQPLNSIPQHL